MMNDSFFCIEKESALFDFLHSPSCYKCPPPPPKHTLRLHCAHTHNRRQQFAFISFSLCSKINNPPYCVRGCVQVQRNLQACAAHILGLIRTNETCVVIKKMAILGADLSLGLLSLFEMTIITMYVSVCSAALGAVMTLQLKNLTWSPLHACRMTAECFGVASVLPGLIPEGGVEREREGKIKVAEFPCLQARKR